MNQNVILYSNGCPKCKVIESKLAVKNINYIKNENVSEVADMGFQSLPVLKIDENYLSFVDANNWVNSQAEQSPEPELVQDSIQDDFVNACSVS
ncbi:MAG: hypothetical protein IKE41_04120 [Clostridia bacterium]|nr:hypothetical protein [Clostridia bacterium]